MKDRRARRHRSILNSSLITLNLFILYTFISLFATFDIKTKLVSTITAPKILDSHLLGNLPLHNNIHIHNKYLCYLKWMTFSFSCSHVKETFWSIIVSQHPNYQLMYERIYSTPETHENLIINPTNHLFRMCFLWVATHLNDSHILSPNIWHLSYIYIQTDKNFPYSCERTLALNEW